MIPKWLILKKSGDVLAAHCTCMAGLGECCSHVGAVLFFLQYISLKKSESEISVTDVSAYWVTPSKKNIEPKKISSIDFSHPKTIDPYCSLTYKSKTDLIKILPKTLSR